MQEKNRRNSFAVIVGFLFCILLILVVFGVAFHGLTAQDHEREYLNQISLAIESANHARYAFETMNAASSRWRATGDAEFLKQGEMAYSSMEESLHRWQDHAIDDPENREWMQRITVMLEEKRRLDEMLVQLIRENARNQEEMNSFREVFRKKFHELQEVAIRASKQAAGEKAGEGEPVVPLATLELQASLHGIELGIERDYRLFAQSFVSGDKKRQQEVFETFSKDLAKNEKELEEMVKSFVTPAAVAMARELIDYFRRIREITMLRMDLQGKKAALDEESAHRELEVREVFLNILELMSDHRAKMEETARYHSMQLISMVSIVCVTGVIFCLITGIVVARLVRRETDGNEVYAAVAVPGGESRDLRLVADKLQEVVNLLRR